ncbi:sulfatase [Rhodobacteraceae bacterium KLH11]|nr:sulfatase [Rhodobacteraceae bacterium KLH11]
MSEKQNVLFIVIDQLRADCLFGGLAEYVDLPNLRALMDDSITFARHFSVTNPCGPSRASLLTGQYAMNHRSVRNGTPLRHDAPTIASEMRKAGYLPMLFGYTDTSQDPRVFDANDPALKSYEFAMPGFQEMVEMRMEMSFPWRSHLKTQGYQFDTYADVYKPVSPDGGAPALNDPALYSAEDSDTAFLTNRFLETMPAYADAEQGWFAHLTYLRPHPPLVAPAPYNRMYDPDALPLPTRLATIEAEDSMHGFLAATRANSKVSGFVEGFPDLEPTDETVRTLRSVYLGLTTEVDHHIGRVVRFLKDSGQYDNTLLVVTADHGEMLGDRHSWGKMSVFDAAYHTPLIIHMPGGENGAHITAPTESIDITPTILEWIGQAVPDAMNGRSLLPFLHGTPPSDWRTFSFSELDFADPLEPTRWQQDLGTGLADSCLGILRDDRFTLVEFAADLPPLLFDGSAKGELENVAGHTEHAETLAHMTREMLRHRMRHMDKTLSNWMITPQGPRHP